MGLLDRVRAPVQLLAPEWLRRAAAPTPGPVPVERSVRAVIAVTTPLALGLLLGQLSVTVLIGIGALIGSVVDRDVPYRQRVVRTGGAVLAGTAGWMIGRTVQHLGPVPVVVAVVVAVAVVASLISEAGVVASLAGLQLLLMTTVASGRTFPGPVWMPGLLYLAGGAWALLLSLLFGIGRRSVPERRTTAAVYSALADQLAGSAAGDRDAAETARGEVTSALSTAYDTLFAVRFSEGGRDRIFRRLFALLGRATVLSEAATAALREGERVPDAAVEAARGVADAIRHGGEAPAAVVWEPTSPGTRALHDALEDARRTLDDDRGDDGDRWRPPGLRERVERLREQLAPGPAGWRAAARLALCMAAAEIVAHVDTTQRSYWVPLTVALVLKPDLGSVFARALQRGAGTVVGVLIGAAVIEFVPVGPWMLPVVAVLAAIVPIGISRNYGMFSTFLTPLVLILIDLISHLGGTLVLDRLLDSLIGVGLVLLLGYVVWPESWHVRLGAGIADTLDGLDDYLRESLGDGRPPAAEERIPARRRAYRRLGTLRTSFQQAMTEPGPVGRRAGAWWPAVIGLERTTDAVTRAATAVAGGVARPARDDLAQLEAVLADLARTVRDQDSPSDLPLPGDRSGRDRSGIGEIAAELGAVRGVLGTPAGRERTATPAHGPTGRVVDEAGRAVVGAMVTVTDAGGRQRMHTRTDERGTHALPPGDGPWLTVCAAPGRSPAARWSDGEGPTVLLPAAGDR